MADDGGSTGVLRDEMGVLPPGDIRQCLIALSEESELLRDLFSYRFENGDLSGHTFGNLFLSALEKVTGNFTDGVKEASRILRVRGKVVPVTEGQMRLVVTLKDGTEINGEQALDSDERVESVGVKEISLKENVRAYKPAIDAIENADAIVIGPGDLYGSVLPNLLLSEVSDAINKSVARVLYIANLTNKKGQTDGFGVKDYVSALEKFIGEGRVNAVFANSEKPNLDTLSIYEKQEGPNTLVLCDKSDGLDDKRCVCTDLLSHKKPKVFSADAIKGTRSLIRHDPEKLARVIMEYLGN